MNFKDKKEKEILNDFRSLAEKLTKVNNFSGLLMYQSDIQRLYEDFIFLKKLNDSKDAKFYQPEEKIIESPQVEEKAEIKTETPSTDQNLFENIEAPKVKETSVAQPKPLEEVLTQTSQTNTENKLHSNNESTDGKIDFNFSIQSGTKHKPLLIDVNDNIAFLNYLFKGEQEEYETFIENLNDRNLVTSESYINHYIELKGWGKKQAEYIERLSELNQRRFE